MRRHQKIRWLISGGLGVVRAGLYVACFVGGQIVMGMLMGLLVSIQMMMIFGEVDQTIFMQAITRLSGEISLLGGLLTLLSVSVFFWIQGKSPLEQAQVRSTGKQHYLPAIVLAMLLYLAICLIFLLLPASWLDSYAQAVQGVNQTGFAMFIAIVLVAPVVEEVIFRGLVLSRLNQVMPTWLALVLSALTFGVLHGHPVWMAYASVMGLVFGLVSIRTGSILPALVMHMVFNGIQYLNTLFSGSVVYPGVQIVFVLVSCGAGLLCRHRVASLLRWQDLSHYHPRTNGGQVVWDADSGADHRF